MPIVPFKPGGEAGGLSKGNKVTQGGLAARLKAAQAKREAKAAEAATRVFPNRILLMLDASGSMDSDADYTDRPSKPKIVYLKDALQSFAESINSDDTSVACVTIPWDKDYIQPPTNQPAILLMYNSRLHTLGATPLGDTMQRGLNGFSFTRGIIISDGSQTDGDLCFQVAKDFAEAGIPVDCVHIGRNSDGEETLKEIASITHGLFIKFDDIGNFAKNFKFLTPGLRAMLTDGSDTARLLGAKEVR